jgi:hypothetical protein
MADINKIERALEILDVNKNLWPDVRSYHTIREVLTTAFNEAVDKEVEEELAESGVIRPTADDA